MTQGSTVVTTQYFDGFQYVNNVLQFFPHAEGYVNNTVVNGSNVYNYAFHYTDHLGNVRLTYGIDPATGLVTVMEENNYYPFGLKHTNYNVTQKDYIKNGGGVGLGPCSSCPNRYQYKYQGQEWQDELGLNWYSFKWRNEDPAIGRFMSIDPLSEVYEWQSVYAFGSNQPVHAKELEGMESKKDLNGNNRSWSISKFLEGAKETASAMVNPTSNVIPGIDLGEIVNVGKKLYKGDVRGAIQSTGLYNMGATVVNATQGDEKAQGSLATVALTAVIMHKVVKSTGPKTSVTASASASEGSASRTGASTTTTAERATQIHSAVPKPTQNRTTVAVADATTASGESVRVVASSEARLRPAQRNALVEGEIEATGTGHAEATILNYAETNNMTVGEISASRPICNNCASLINEAGATPGSPLKKTNN